MIRKEIQLLISRLNMKESNPVFSKVEPAVFYEEVANLKDKENNKSLISSCSRVVNAASQKSISYEPLV